MQAFLRLLEKPDVRRIFGKQELFIIQKQAWGVALTQSEKNRLSRDIRKKLEAVRELARFSGEFRLRKGVALGEKISDVMEAIKADPFFPKIRRVWLFGSTTQKERSLSSDVDVAVELDDPSNRHTVEFRRRILGQFEKDVDVQVLESLPKEVKAQVRKGKVLYERADAGQGG